MIAGMPLSMPVFIGLLMLLGIVAKNSILLIDFALEEMMAGVAPRDGSEPRYAESRPSRRPAPMPSS